MTTQKNTDLYSPAEMTRIAENSAFHKINKPTKIVMVSAIVAGFFVAIAFAFYVSVTLGTGTMPYGMVKLIGGICFSLGLMLILVCGNDLFTSTILTILPVITKKSTLPQMAKNWALVYIGNFIGALALVTLIWFSGQTMSTNGLWGANVLAIAKYKLQHSFIEAVLLGTLANVMVCLAVWMSYAGRTLMDKSFIMILPIAMFVAGGFEHSIANMFLIPLGIIIAQFSPAEFWSLIGQSSGDYAALTFSNFVIDNLIPVTIGNILGGLLISITYWYLHLNKK